MATEIKTIQITAYRNEQGEKTCATDFSTGKVCQFMHLRKFGQVASCYYTGNGLEQYRKSKYLMPDNECPVWGKDE